MGRTKWIAVVVGALLTLSLVGTALADPPTPGNPTPPPTPPAGSWGDMRDWMDRNWGQGFFDRMHGSYEGMVETCNTMMGSSGAGGMMGSGGMMGTGGMVESGGAVGSGGMMGFGTRTSSQGRYGGMMGSGNWATRSGGWGGMMGNFLGGLGTRLIPTWF